ncbi:MAG TPA: hypothetical protein PLA68_11380 [Panacibacter sp.]|nr:hypothetical protein [Panacibacter sp.]
MPNHVAQNGYTVKECDASKASYQFNCPAQKENPMNIYHCHLTDSG